MAKAAKTKKFSSFLERFTHAFSKWTGSEKGFVTAALSLFVWLIIGKFFDYSSHWTNLFSVYISSMTFLMIFLIQRSHNRDLLALHIKLNELIATSKEADNRIINIETLTEKEISSVQQIHSSIAGNLHSETPA